MLAILDKFQFSFSPKAFAAGLIGVLVIYICLFSYVGLRSAKTIEHLEQTLATHTIMIDLPEIAPDPVESDPVGGEQASTHQEGHQQQPSPPAHDTKHTTEGHNTAKHTQTEDDGRSLAQILHGSAVTSAHSLRSAPINNLFENSPQGILPIKKKGLPSVFEAYRKPFVLNRNKRAVAIAIVGYGLSEHLSAEVLTQMPTPISLILSPYATHVDAWQKKARLDGHEIWMGLPVQTMDFPRRDPGSKGLLSDVSLAYNEERVEWVLSRTSGYAGLASFTDLALKKSSPMFGDIFKKIFDRGLGLLEMNPDGNDFIAGIAKRKNAPYAIGHVTLKAFTPENPLLKIVEGSIEKNQHTIIMVQPTVKNLGDLKEWITRLEAKGVVIVPVSALAALSVE